MNNKIQLKPVTLEYNNLLNKSIDISKQIEEAFGKNGAGIAFVKNIPNYKEYKLTFSLLLRNYINSQMIYSTNTSNLKHSTQ
jgi:hypothetical protein